MVISDMISFKTMARYPLKRNHQIPTTCLETKVFKTAPKQCANTFLEILCALESGPLKRNYFEDLKPPPAIQVQSLSLEV